MVSKIIKLYLFISVLFFSSIYCQNTKVATITDVDSIPVQNFHSQTEMQDSIVYITSDCKRINVNYDVEFNGGLDSLHIFCDSLYYNRKDYNQQELNEYVIYYILFDTNLHIQDVRISSHLLGYCGKYNYNELFKQILFKTEGKWKVKKNPSKTWHLYIGSHRYY